MRKTPPVHAGGVFFKWMQATQILHFVSVVYRETKCWINGKKKHRVDGEIVYMRVISYISPREMGRSQFRRPFVCFSVLYT